MTVNFMTGLYKGTLSGQTWIAWKQCCGSVTFWIRIRGSVPLTYGSGFESGSGSWPGSCSFRLWPSRCQQKTFFSKFFAYYPLFEGTFSSVFIEKTVEIKVFLTIFLLYREGSGSGSVQIKTYPDPGGTKFYGSGSTTMPGSGIVG
jgi:hypothetical protein